VTGAALGGFEDRIYLGGEESWIDGAMLGGGGEA